MKKKLLPNKLNLKYSNIYSKRFILLHIVISTTITYLWSIRYIPASLFIYIYAIYIGLYVSKGREKLDKILSIYLAIAWVYYSYTYLFKIGGANTPYNNPAPLWLLLIKDLLFIVLIIFAMMFYKPKIKLVIPYLLLMAPLIPHFLVKDWYYVIKNEYLDTFQFVGLFILAKDRNIKSIFFDLSLLMGFQAAIGAIFQTFVGSTGPADLQISRRATSTLGTSLTLGPALGLTFWVAIARMKNKNAKIFHFVVAGFAVLGIIFSVSLTSIMSFLFSIVIFILCFIVIRQRIPRLAPAAGFLIIFILVIFYHAGTSFHVRPLDRFKQIQGTYSFLGVKHIKDATTPFDLTKQNISSLLGLGEEVFLESGYATIYFDFGIIGLLIFFVVLANVLIFAAKYINTEKGFVAFFFLLMIFFGFIGMKYFSMFPINVFIYIVIGILYNNARWKIKIKG